MPSDAPRPMKKINRANGRSPFVGAPLCLSLRARNMIKRTAVAKNSEKKHDAAAIFCGTQDIHQTSCCAQTKGAYSKCCKKRSSGLRADVPSFEDINCMEIICVHQRCTNKPTQHLRGYSLENIDKIEPRHKPWRYRVLHARETRSTSPSQL